MKRDPFDVIKRPVISEKSNMLNSLRDRIKGFNKAKYVFLVDIKAGKREIKEAVEAIYKDKKIEVDSVNTVIVKPKPKNYRGVLGTTKRKKKAIVTLKEGGSIDEKK